MTDSHRRIVPGQAAADTTTPPPPPPAFAALAEGKIEDDAHPIELPDGRTAVLARPKGSNVARVIMIASELTEGMLGKPAAQTIAITSLQPYIEALIHIQQIDGKRVIPITNATTYQQLADSLGDEGINAVLTGVFERWPPPSPEKIKKNRERSQLS